MLATSNTTPWSTSSGSDSTGLVDRIRGLLGDSVRVARQLRRRRVVATLRTPSLLANPLARAEGDPLSPFDAVRQNGFTVFRGPIPANECVGLAERMKAEAGFSLVSNTPSSMQPTSSPVTTTGPTCPTL